MIDEREFINQQINLALIGFNVCKDIINKGSMDDIFKADYIVKNNPFNTSFIKFINDYYCEVENCIYIKSLKSTTLPINTIYDNLEILNLEYEDMISYLNLNIDSIAVVEFVINLLISQKVLVLLHMKGELEKLEKKTIIDIRRFTNYILNYIFKFKTTEYEEKTDKVLKELDVKINDYVCKFNKNTTKIINR